MLQPAYLARNASEEAFASLDKSFSEYQNNHPRSTSYNLGFTGYPTDLEMKAIALHFATAGYDVSSDSRAHLIISWENAKEGWTGAINIGNSICHFKQASYQKNEE